MTYKYLLFDLDGTLILSHPGIYACMRAVFDKWGIPQPPETEMKRLIGPPIPYAMQNFYGMDEENAIAATQYYREHYSKTGVYENTPIEGAKEALKTLKERGYVLVMATSKPQRFAELIAKQWHFDEDLTLIVGAEDKHLNTKAKVVAFAMEKLGANKQECLMIGDRKHDVEGARENGVDCAMLKVGYAEEGEEALCKPKYVFENYKQLVDFLL